MSVIGDALESVPCNLCGADDTQVIYPARYEHETAESLAEKFKSSGDELLVDQLVRCRACGLEYLNPRPRPDLVLEGYSSGEDPAFVSQAASRERTFARCLDLVEANVSGRGRLLDIGTAGGSFLHVAKSRGWEVAGCEPSRWLCDWSAKHYGLTVHPGTIFDMPGLVPASFDVITLWDVLEHVPDPAKVLDECRRLLKPGGLLVVNYPDIGAWISRAMGRRWVFLLSVHLYYFTRTTISKMLRGRGFEPFLLKPHFQTLELGYLFHRMRAYIPVLPAIAEGLVKAVGLSRVQVPYWVGQTLVCARRTA